MWFGQKIYVREGKAQHGKWLPYDTREAAINAGSTLVSILELCCTSDQFLDWQNQVEQAGGDPRKVRPAFPFRGPFYADFDNSEDLDGLKKELARRLTHIQETHNLEDEDFQLWYSGSKGFHLIMDPALYGAQKVENKNLPDIYKIFACGLGLGDIMDPVVYSKGRGRLWRVEGHLRSNGCRKIPISLGQLRGLSVADIQKLARSSSWYRPELRIHPPRSKSLVRVFQEGVEIVMDRERKRIRKPRQKKAPTGTDVLSRALARLPLDYCDNYGEWLSVGMALHDGTDGGLEGLKLWHEWSRQSDKYDAHRLDHLWDGFSDDPHGISVGTLFYLAGKQMD